MNVIDRRHPFHLRIQAGALGARKRATDVDFG
jgi:hypothetical protein